MINLTKKPYINLSKKPHIKPTAGAMRYSAALGARHQKGATVHA